MINDQLLYITNSPLYGLFNYNFAFSKLNTKNKVFIPFNTSLKKYFWGSCKLPQTHKKYAWKWKKCEKRNKQRKNNTGIQNVVDRRKHFIGHIRKKLKMIWTNFKSKILNTIKVLFCLVNEWMGAKGMVFECGCMNGCHKTCNGCYLELATLTSSIVG